MANVNGVQNNVSQTNIGSNNVYSKRIEKDLSAPILMQIAEARVHAPGIITIAIGRLRAASFGRLTRLRLVLALGDADVDHPVDVDHSIGGDQSVAIDDAFREALQLLARTQRRLVDGETQLDDFVGHHGVGLSAVRNGIGHGEREIAFSRLQSKDLLFLLLQTLKQIQVYLQRRTPAR